MSSPVQHGINATVVAVPAASIWLHLPEELSILLTLVGLIWYGVLFYDRFILPRLASKK